MRQVKRLLPYVRRYVQMAVYDVLDAEGAEYRKEESGQGCADCCTNSGRA